MHARSDDGLSLTFNGQYYYGLKSSMFEVQGSLEGVAFELLLVDWSPSAVRLFQTASALSTTTSQPRP
jgi:hypothetical protein